MSHQGPSLDIKGVEVEERGREGRETGGKKEGRNPCGGRFGKQ